MKRSKKWALAYAGSLLLAIPLSFSALAFTGWVEDDDGTTIYLDKYGERVKDTWMKRGKGNYYLDENGVVLTNQFVEFDGYDCYVDETGAIAKNKWVSALNEDDACDQDVDILWYFFDSNGHMVKGNKKAKKINVLPKSNGDYFFDDDGHMLSGWQDITDDDGEENTYYLGEGDDGKVQTEWRLMEPRENTEPAEGMGDYDEMVWYYFDWKGKQIKNQEKKINQSWYHFDENGVMITGWYPGVEPDFAVNTYYDKETGARAQGWIYAYEQDDYDESGEQYWYYLDKKGKVFNEGGVDAEKNSPSGDARIALKRVDGDTYGFDARGRMITGLIDTREAGGGINQELILEEFQELEGPIARTSSELEPGIYYFEDLDSSRPGKMKTGKIRLEDSGETVSFMLRKNGQAYAAVLADGYVYGIDGRIIHGDQQTEVIQLSYDIYGKEAKEEDEPVIPAGSSFIVTASGKVKKSGAITVDGVRYQVEQYVVVGSEERTK